ncbi:MAG TPA: prolyl oligopeptidase family serine peptidase [Chitinophagaceae bacterium]|nr:prolyl oligopeptidase family serine peptidase [Chitinophagaceae bacterium]
MGYCKKYFAGIVTIGLLVFAACSSGKQLTGKNVVQDTENWVSTLHDSLHIKTYKSAGITAHPNLVIVLHGDAPFNNPGYQYILVSLLAKENTNTLAVAILRPGYTDSENVHSPGVRGLTTGDNYTKGVVDDIAAAINNLKVLYHPANTVIAGHSGGSAITADIISTHPGIADAAAIVSCPCNVTEWRAHMKVLQNNAKVWDTPVQSLSPNELVNGISKKTNIVIVTGDKDNVAPTTLSINYYNQLKQRGLNARLVTVKGAGHEIFLTNSVLTVIAGLLKHNN